MNKNYVLILGAIILVAVFGVSYMMWFTSPNYVVQTVTIIANTENGCIAETMDGFSVNIGQCDVQPNDIISAKYDINTLKREIAMNP